MITGIYKITNIVTNKKYIGQSINIKRRWREEKTAAFSSKDLEYNSVLSKAIRKYGLNNFKFEVIEECEKEKLNERERYWIQYYNSYLKGYNCNLGGSSVSQFIKISKEKLNDIILLLKEGKLKEQEIAQKLKVSIGTVSSINQGSSWKIPGQNYPIRRRINDGKRCLMCNCRINHRRNICLNCYQKTLFGGKVPTKEQMITLIKEFKGNITAISRLYKISKTPFYRLIKKYKLEKELQYYRLK